MKNVQLVFLALSLIFAMTACAAAETSVQQKKTEPASQRVVLYEEEPSNPEGKRLVGTVRWSTEMSSETPGRPSDLAVRADIDVPDRKMRVTMSFRRNTDKSLPASHTIELVFTQPNGSPFGGIQKVPGLLMINPRRHGASRSLASRLR